MKKKAEKEAVTLHLTLKTFEVLQHRFEFGGGDNYHGISPVKTAGKIASVQKCQLISSWQKNMFLPKNNSVGGIIRGKCLGVGWRH